MLLATQGLLNDFFDATSFNIREKTWSGRRDSNPRLQPWQGCALPLSYARSIKRKYFINLLFVAIKIKSADITIMFIVKARFVTI